MFTHILLATDGSASSRHAAALAVSLAQVHGAKLTALYVADPYPYLGIGELNPGGMQAYASAGQQLAAQAHAEVDALCRAAPRPLALVDTGAARQAGVWLLCRHPWQSPC